MAVIELGPWKPDLPALGNTCLIAKNVIRGQMSYRQFRAFANTITALAERIQGAIAVKETGGGAHVYAGTNTTLQQLPPGATAFTDRSGTTYSCAADETWSFASNTSSVFAANIANAIQASTVGASSSFADLAAAAPKCRRLGIWGVHLVAANLLDGSTYYPHAVQWCGQTAGVGDPTSWPTIGSVTAAQQRSDRRYLDGGAVTGIISGEFGGYVVAEKKIFRATTDAGSLFFDIQPVEINRGSRFPGSIAAVGRILFYLGDDGMWMFDGLQSVPIGAQKIDRWLLADLDPIYIPRICSAIDPVNKLYVLAYPGSGHSGGNLNRLAIFNWSPGVMEWSYVDLTGADLDYLFPALSLGYTLDSLDSLGFTLDSLPFSLDSYVWQGGVPYLGAVDSSHRAGAFTGSAMAARLTTGHFQHIAGRRALTTSATPLVEGSAATVTVTPLTKARSAAAMTTGTASTMNAAGECPMMASGRYHGYQVDITGGFDEAIGVDPTFEDDGAY